MSIDVHAYYYVLKRIARDVVAEDINAKIQAAGARDNWRGMTLASIDEEALRVARLE